jgi:hypothetical protein
MTDLPVERLRPFTNPARAQMAAPAVFAGVLFFSAALIFLVQPMFARMTTPLLGGTPAVWNTAMVFFQAALLVGYLYAHLIVRFLSLRAQVVTHGVVLGLGCIALPVQVTSALGAPSADMPALWLMGVMALSVGLPYAAASATAPLLQAWYARTGRADAADPYHLYAASNLGSLLGLMAYPLAVEPLMPLASQANAWSLGYLVLGAAIVLTGALAIACNTSAPTTPVAADTPASAAAPVTWKDRAFWIAAAAIPSSLLLGASQHIATDVASAPFLWVVPLGLYLLTFVLAFEKGGAWWRSITPMAHVAAVALAVLFYSGASWFVSLPVTLAAFFFSALICHFALAARRPDAARLTEFYLFVSLGGVLGGAITALLAPVLLDAILEYPIALALAALLRPSGETALKRGANILAAAAAAACGVFWLAHAGGADTAKTLLICAMAVTAGALAANRARPWVFAGLVALGLFTGHRFKEIGATLDQDRSFFGVHRVVEKQGPHGPVRLLMHGTTLHGAQSLAPGEALKPITYFSVHSPMGQAVHQSIRTTPGPAKVGVLGLGVGAISCHLRSGDTIRYYEIDPIVVRFARDAGHFSFLQQCSPNAEMIIGDGRLTVAAAPDGYYDVLVIDAFSSDSVPTHLITREALQLYMRKTAPGGVVVFNLSNRNIALAGEAARIVAAEGLTGAWAMGGKRSEISAGDYESLQTKAMIVARTPDVLARLQLGKSWAPAVAPAGAPWTDDYVSLPRAILAHMAGEQ